MKVGGSSTSATSEVTSSEGGISHLALLNALNVRDRGIVIFDSRLQICHINRSTFALLGIDQETTRTIAKFTELLLSCAFAFENSSLQRAMALEDSLEAANSGEDQVVCLTPMTKGKAAVQLRVRPLGNGYAAAYFELAESADEPCDVAPPEITADSLTGLASRRGFELAVNATASWAPASAVAVLLVDLDRFKAVNDTLGHAAGDSLLKMVGQRIRASVRQGDVVARFGGDEFAMLLAPVSDRRDVRAVAERAVDLVQRTYLIEGQVANVGASIGIAVSPEDGTDCESLIMAADLALYEAKASGRAGFRFFDPSMSERAQARRTSELDLRRALALRQLELYYQPQVTMEGGLVGFEALLRWRHPQKGFIPPSEFIPLAERIGAILPIGEWVLRTAAKEALNWPEHLTVAVNASPIQLERGSFSDVVRRALTQTGLPGHRLEIEITEGMLLDNAEVVMQTLNDLRSLGVRIAMDDFGTGYASLSQLAKFPFDKIKIDKSLAGSEGDNIKKRAIVRAITALGESLGACTLAEGVEDEEQLARLQMDGCASVQGYLFGRPVPVTDLGDVIRKLTRVAHKSHDQEDKP